MARTKVQWRTLTPKELEILDKRRRDEQAAHIKKLFATKAPLILLDDCDPVFRVPE